MEPRFLLRDGATGGCPSSPSFTPCSPNFCLFLLFLFCFVFLLLLFVFLVLPGLIGTSTPSSCALSGLSALSVSNRAVISWDQQDSGAETAVMVSISGDSVAVVVKVITLSLRGFPELKGDSSCKVCGLPVRVQCYLEVIAKVKATGRFKISLSVCFLLLLKLLLWDLWLIMRPHGLQLRMPYYRDALIGWVGGTKEGRNVAIGWQRIPVPVSRSTFGWRRRWFQIRISFIMTSQ